MDIKILFATLIRQAVTSVGAILVAKGILSPELLASFTDSATGLAVGAAALIGGYIWSLASKKKALDTPVPPAK